MPAFIPLRLLYRIYIPYARYLICMYKRDSRDFTMWVFSYPDLLSTVYEITICVVFILVTKKEKEFSN